jgi:NAD(P)H-hydrate epimerase
VLPLADLVVDAAYGTGFRGTWDAPSPAGAPVLAVDIPSGVDALTGAAGDSTWAAVRTITFQAVKPGHLLGRGAELAGEVVVADIGLDVSGASSWLVEDGDVVLPDRPRDAHKWRSAVWVVAGSPGMTGAAHLATRAAQRTGAGYVRLSVPGGAAGEGTPVEAVGVPLPASGWVDEVLDGMGRFGAAVVGPGLGRGSDDDVRALVAAASVPLVVDGDGLTALGRHPQVPAHVVLTPHDGEHERLTGAKPGADRIAAARALAASTGATVLLKGPTTVVAEPGGRVLLSATGDARLASAGTGDVLSGIIGALLASGVAPLEAAAWGAHLHGLAGQAGPARGLVAGDLLDRLPEVLAAVG